MFGAVKNAPQNVQDVHAMIIHLFTKERGYLFNACRDGFAMEKVWLNFDEDGDDILMDGIAYCLKKAPEYDPEKSIVKTWVYQQVKWGANSIARSSKSRINRKDCVVWKNKGDGEKHSPIDIVPNGTREEIQETAIYGSFDFDPSGYVKVKENGEFTTCLNGSSKLFMKSCEQLAEKMRVIQDALEKDLEVTIKANGKVMHGSYINNLKAKNGMVSVHWRRTTREIAVVDISEITID